MFKPTEPCGTFGISSDRSLLIERRALFLHRTLQTVVSRLVDTAGKTRRATAIASTCSWVISLFNLFSLVFRDQRLLFSDTDATTVFEG